MGCCESASVDEAPLSPIINPVALSSLNSVQKSLYQKFITAIPIHCRQEILALPPSSVATAAEHRQKAADHLGRREFLLATQDEFQAMKILQDLLPNHRDHIVFADIYRHISACQLGLGEVRIAVEGIQMALVILLKYTPTDYETLSETYFQLTESYKTGQAWDSAVSSLTKAFETARLSSPPNQQRIRELETDLKLTKNRALDKTLPNVTIYEERLDPSQGEEYFRRRGTAEIYADSAQDGILPFDLSEIKRVPDKETESQVTQEILQQVLTVFDNDLNGYYVRRFEEGCTEIEFIAANYKQRLLKDSPLSPAIIEAALTMIIDRLNMSVNDEQFASVKQSPLTISYTDDNQYYEKGVRVFRITTKEGINLNKNKRNSYIDRDFHQFVNV